MNLTDFKSIVAKHNVACTATTVPYNLFLWYARINIWG